MTVVGFVTLDWRLALAFCSVFVVHAIGLRRFLGKAGRIYAADRAAAGTRTQAVLNALHGARTVHAYGMEARQRRVVDEASTAAIGASLRAFRHFFSFSSFMNIAEAVGLSALIITGFLLVRGDAVTVGAVTAAALLFQRLFGPLGMLLFSFNEVQTAGAALTRLVGVAEMSVPEVRPVQPKPASAGLVAREVRHHYLAGPEVLHGVDVTVPAGRSLAVVGESGAGKTTLAAILGGVFPGSSGAVSVGPTRIEDLDPVALRARVGVVTQDVHVFSGRLRDDLTLAVPDATDDQIHAALLLVGADEWVAALPDGLDTQVGRGSASVDRGPGPADRAGPDRPRGSADGDPRRGHRRGGQRRRAGTGGVGAGRAARPHRRGRRAPAESGAGVRPDRRHVRRPDRRAGQSRRAGCGRRPVRGPVASLGRLTADPRIAQELLHNDSCAYTVRS